MDIILETTDRSKKFKKQAGLKPDRGIDRDTAAL